MNEGGLSAEMFPCQLLQCAMVVTALCASAIRDPGVLLLRGIGNHYYSSSFSQDSPILFSSPDVAPSNSGPSDSDFHWGSNSSPNAAGGIRGTGGPWLSWCALFVSSTRKSTGAAGPPDGSGILSPTHSTKFSQESRAQHFRWVLGQKLFSSTILNLVAQILLIRSTW